MLSLPHFSVTLALNIYPWFVRPLYLTQCHGCHATQLFDAKGMAGNIIHAIATTNAIISGLIVIEAIKILAGAALHC